uniref:NADH-ubiquinone oxidoreductase chain 3 n=1 Tax=Blastopsylla occidentalis TaxID=121832 RepID=A0A2U9QJG0_BLAOC|nr:NADH dehydrogenase subunit 3 [Blastopsylla occidentalis]AWU48863.1 NADH dehydrogenase subunit 3 [Blastopsylla occidentalis]
MMLITFMITMFMIIFMVVYFIIPIFNIHKMSDREKNSPFECGFDPFSNSRVSFSIHFFSIMLMFLIFDIEIVILIPLPLTLNFTQFISWAVTSLILILTLILGLVIEWKEGSMVWK